MIPQERLDNRGRFVGCEMQHEWPLYDVLNDILLPNSHIQTIVEIGTGHGALTLVLGLFGVKIDAKVLTIDIDPALSDDAVGFFDHLDITRLTGNEYAEEVMSAIEKWVGLDPTYVLCDGDNKDWELRYWWSRLPQGSLISVHDWGDAVKPARVPVELEPYRPEDWDRARLATWRVPCS